MWRSALVLLALTATAHAAPSMRVGSKQFTEGVILGEIVSEVGLDAGAHVDHEAQMGGTRILWTALEHGDIDVYVEYTGTIVEEILAGENLPRAPRLRSGQSDLPELRRALAAHGIGLIGPLGFANTYALGMRADRADALGVHSISDLAAHPELTLGLSNEFLDRKDGWPGLRDRYGLPHSPTGLVHDLAYKALSSRDIDVTDVYTTDAEIERLGVRVLDDDRHYFPDYDAVILYRQAWADGAPEVVAALQRLAGAIAPADMIAMNAEVRIDHKSEVDVAGAFVRDHLGMRARRTGAGRAERIWQRTREHLALVALALLLAIAVAVPLGIAAARRPVLGQIVLGAVGILQTVPSLALLVLLIQYLGIGGPPAVAAMFTYSLLPIVRNTHAGLTGIATPVRESAEVLGLSRWAQLVRVELPLASPSILAGIQTAAVLSVGTATIGALVGAGGYGQPILTGIRLDDHALILEGALPAAAMALLVQAFFEGVERLVVPKPLRLAAMRAPLAVALLALTACGGKHHTDTNPVDNAESAKSNDGDDMTYGGEVTEEEREPPPPPEPPKPPDITGAWNGPCSPTAAEPKVNGRFTFTFTADGWTLDMQRYSDAACTKRTWAIQGTGTYAFGEQSGAGDGAWNTDVTIASYTLTADDKATAKKLAKTCGVKLKAKKALDISAKGCPKLMIRPIADCGHMYDVIAVKAGQLYFGAHPADNDTCTEDKRPTALAEHGLMMTWTPVGLANCDAYGARAVEYGACDKVPEEERSAAMEGLFAMKSAWDDTSSYSDDEKKAVNDACQQALDALNQTMTAAGC